MELVANLSFLIAMAALIWAVLGGDNGFQAGLAGLAMVAVLVFNFSAQKSEEDKYRLSSLSKRCAIEGTVYQYPGQDVKDQTKKLREALFNQARCEGSIQIKVVRPETAQEK